MVNGWALEQNREVTAANFSYYKKPELHPNRIMRQHDLIYILDGTWCIGQDNEVFEVSAGDVIALQAGHYHYGARVCRPDTRTMFIHFSKAEKDCIAPAGTNRDPGMTWADGVVCCRSRSGVKRLFEEIIDTFWSDRQNKAFCLSALISLLLCELSDQSVSGIRCHDPLIEESLHLIKQRPEHFFSIQELADLTFVSAKTLTGRFKKATGQTVHQYQMNLKLEMVEMQIRTNPFRSLRDLSENFGFCDEFHLSRLFKRKFGVSPGEYLRRQG